VQIREISWDEVLRAGVVIFGPTFASVAGAGGWRGELKRAYRRRVLETHPDRAASLGRSEAELNREFRDVAEAYELLAELRAGPPPRAVPSARTAPSQPTTRARRTAPPQRQASPRPAARRADRASPPPPAPPPRERPPPRGAAWTARPAGRAPAAPPPASPRPAWRGAALPRRRLRIAEFLYYSGQVAWRDFVAAIAWQRSQRPAVGRIAVGFGFLEQLHVAEILERRRVEGAGAEPFGEFAVRRGYLTPYQLLAMLGQQLRLQRPIGRYFVERGLVSEQDLDAARVAVFRHNARQAG